MCRDLQWVLVHLTGDPLLLPHVEMLPQWRESKTEPLQFHDLTSTARLSTAMRPPPLRGLNAVPCTLWGSSPQRSALAIASRFSRGPGPPLVGLRGYRKKAVVQQVQPPVKPEEVKLRKYQLECIQAVVESFKQGHKRVGVSLATGGGKTVCVRPTFLYIFHIRFWCTMA